MTNFQCRSKEIFIFFAFTAAGLSIFMDYNFLLFILPMRYWDLYCELVASKIFIHSVLHQLVSGFSSLEDFFLWISSPFCNPLGPDDTRIFPNFITKKTSIVYQDEEYFDSINIVMYSIENKYCKVWIIVKLLDQRQWKVFPVPVCGGSKAATLLANIKPWGGNYLVSVPR